MKHSRPHLLYLALIVAIGVFYRQRLQSENQRIALLNRTTDETIESTGHINGEVRKEIRKYAKAYPSPKHLEVLQMALEADSLINLCGTEPVECDSLIPHLEMMAAQAPGISKRFKTLASPGKRPGFSSAHQYVISQNDTLRRLLALTELLHHYGAQTGETGLRFEVFQPAVSSTNICQGTEMPFEAEIFLSTFKTPQSLRLSANGQNLVYEDGLAHFVHTFPAPGVYPLHVKAEVRNFDSDSLIVAEKTFYLHVSQ